MPAFTDQLLVAILLGVYVGVIPVYLGFFPLPILRRVSGKWVDLLVSITVGVLLFLLFDVVSEAFEMANALTVLLGPASVASVPIPIANFDLLIGAVLGGLLGPTLGAVLLIIGVAIGLLGLVGVGTRLFRESEEVHTTQSSLKIRVYLAYMIALSIGLHNLGEGLAIGAAFTLGNIALGSVLVAGFAVHNTTEGFAIVAPVFKERMGFLRPAKMGAIAGVPTIIGTMLGLFLFSNGLAIIFFGVAAGAILYVVSEITLEMGGRFSNNLLDYAGIIGGFAVMYLTSLLIVV